MSCDLCAAECCRLSVVLVEADVVASDLVEIRDGQRTMARGDDGLCKALGADRRCSIYAERPQACRRFVMAGAYCRAVRDDHEALRRRGLPPPDYRSRNGAR